MESLYCFIDSGRPCQADCKAYDTKSQDCKLIILACSLHKKEEKNEGNNKRNRE